MSVLRYVERPLVAAVVLLASACGSSASPEKSTDTTEPSATDDTGTDDTPAADDTAAKPPTTTKPATKLDGSTPAVNTPATAKDGGGKSDPPATTGGKDSGGGGGDAGVPTSTGSTDSGGPTTSTGGGGACLDGITDFGKDGPFKYALKTAGPIKYWVPAVPAGCKVPVVHLANGTGASCSNYQGSLNRMASHGFLAACYEDTNTGAGTQGVMAFETALSMFPDLVDKRLGSTGHSQGGQAAFTVLALAEQKFGAEFIYAGLAMEPASGFGTQPAGGSWQSWYAKIKSPMFMFSGTADMLVSEGWVQSAYNAMNKANEVYWWSAIGATHIPTPDQEEMDISIPWFRWKLLGDNAACKYFKAMPGNGKWEKKMSENEAPCL